MPAPSCPPSLSIAFLVVLEQLEPDERAAFLLHEVFDTGYAEIAADPRQERGGVPSDRQPRPQARARAQAAGSSERRGTPLGPRALCGQAIQMQDKAALLALVAEKASWTSDGGGRARAARKVIRGRERVVSFVLACPGSHATGSRSSMTAVNGEPALAYGAEGKLFSVITVRTDGRSSSMSTRC